jgi:hypothetical protein
MISMAQDAAVFQCINTTESLERLIQIYHGAKRGNVIDSVDTKNPEKEVELLVRENRAWKVHEDVKSAGL